MNMFVTNPAKDIMSSFFSTILSEVKSALLLVFKAIVKCLCVRVAFQTSDRVTNSFLIKNCNTPIGVIETIDPTGGDPNDRLFPRHGLFMICGILSYIVIITGEEEDHEHLNCPKLLTDLPCDLFVYIPRWNAEKFMSVFRAHLLSHYEKRRKGRESVWNSPVNMNVIEELRLIERWSLSREWYTARKIPFTYGLVLHGPPGSGKSTIVNSIAQVSGFEIGSISLRGTIDDFNKSFRALPSKVLLLIEDIDAIFHGRENVCDPINGVDFSTFINALSGVNSKQDRILVITTNRPELLDPALALIPPHGDPVPRPGRIDRVVYVGPLEPDARLKVCKRVLPDRPDLWSDLVLAGEGEVIANFQARCVRVALDLKWAELTKD